MGVTVETIKAGDGKSFPKSGDLLTMHYVGTLANGGTKFDSSRDKNRPFQFPIGVGQVHRQYWSISAEVKWTLTKQTTDRAHVSFCPSSAQLTYTRLMHACSVSSQVIKGWDEGVMKMSLGEKAILRITSDYGYGR
jgi:FK506-binding protein 1